MQPLKPEKSLTPFQCVSCLLLCILHSLLILQEGPFLQICHCWQMLWEKAKAVLFPRKAISALPQFFLLIVLHSGCLKHYIGNIVCNIQTRNIVYFLDEAVIFSSQGCASAKKRNVKPGCIFYLCFLETAKLNSEKFLISFLFLEKFY